MNSGNIYYGMDDDCFEKRTPLNGQITKREIRALSISFLKLSANSVVWDIGSATGSVAIEASRIATDGKIIAIEKDTGSLPLLESNIKKHKAVNVEIIEGTAPEILENLPAPDSIFVGGTGGKLESIIANISNRLHQKGNVVMNFASMERSVTAYNLLKQNGLESNYICVNISRGKELIDKSLVLSPLNPVFIVYGMKQ